VPNPFLAAKTDAIDPGGATVRRSRAAGGSKSGDEFFSVQHPDYRRVEQRFIDGHLYAYLPDDPDRLRKLTGLLSRLKKNTTRDFAATKAVKILGIAAFFPDEWENEPEALTLYDASEEARLRKEIRAIIEERLRSWCAASRSGHAFETRSSGAERLKSIGEALAGEQRGRRRRIVSDAVELAAEYLRDLFRVRRAEALFDIWPWSSARAQKIADVAKACGVPENVLSHHLNLPLTAEASARAWAADTFSVAEDTVSNVLSRSRK
jgi:hypothetical protein